MKTDWGYVHPLTRDHWQRFAHEAAMREAAYSETQLKRTNTVVADVCFVDGKTWVRNVELQPVSPFHTDGRYHIRVRVHGL